MDTIKNLINSVYSYLSFPFLYLISTFYNKGGDDKFIDKEDEPFPKEWNELFINSYTNNYEKVKEIIETDSNCLEFRDTINPSWTALHVAVSNKSFEVIQLLLEKGIEISTQNNKGYTGFHIAACNGDINIIELMIKMNKVPNGLLLSNDMETSLFLACANNHFEIAIMILEYYKSSSGNNEIEFKNILDQFNIHGVTPLIISVLRKNLEMVKTLVENNADINCFKKDNSTPLHCASILNFTDAIKYLIENGANLNSTNRYGNTPLHEAAIKGNHQSIKCFIDNCKDKDYIHSKDKDGSTALHLCCNIINPQEIQNNLESCKVLIEYGGVDINTVDSGNATGLHILACVGEDKALPIVEYFLTKGADPTIENRYGWTPIHQAHHNKNFKIYSKLIQYLNENNPNYKFDIEKKRVFPNNTLSSTSTSSSTSLSKSEDGIKRLEEISKNIQSGKIKNVIVLTGAGISANAGIPPYRTKDGLLNRNQQFSFSMEILEKHPDLFYDTIRNHFYPIIKASNDNDREDGISAGIKSTPSHYFINDLNSKYGNSNGILLRNYTQNVDPLQERTGTPKDKIVHAHGSFDNWYCIVCKKQYDSEKVWREIGRGGLPFCTVPECRYVIRPDVVFFGEGLSQEFKVHTISDFRKCDLLIVMGTSLIVYPFAGLLNDVGIDVPRVLINFESTGPFVNTSDLERKDNLKKLEDQGSTSSGSVKKEREEEEEHLIVEARGNRDVVILGDCDKGVKYFSKILNKTF